MRLVSVKKCQPGMRLAKNIYNEKGMILLSVDVELTQNLLNRLLSKGISHIYIQDPRTDDIIIDDPISDETRMKATAEIRSNFRRLMEDNLQNRKVQHNHFIGKNFRDVVTMIMDDLTNHKGAMMMLSNISVTDHYLFDHSLNVCIYTTMLGMACDYSQDELSKLCMGALLHDVGKTKIPSQILFKEGKLTPEEYKIIQEHTTIGFKLLKDEPNIPLVVAHCAFQHHERINGTGYPRNVEGEAVHDYARWIGLVDAYDAMSSTRVYKEAMLPHQAMEILYTGSGTLFDKTKLEIFRDKFAPYPLGITVKLYSGETGIVVDINSSIPQRPIIRIIQDADGQEVTPYEIDLSKKLNVMIASVNDIKVNDT